MFFQKKMFVFVLCLMIGGLYGCDAIQTHLMPKGSKKKAAAPAQSLSEAQAQAPAARKDDPLPEGVLARVGEWTMPLEEFNRRIEAVKAQVPDFDAADVESKKMILEDIFRQQLLIHEAREKKLDQKKEIQEATREFQNSLLVQEYVTMLTQDIKADEAEAKAYYEQHGDEFVLPVEKQIREIVVPSEAEAKEILVQLLQGADFAKMARERSKAKSAANGGDLGFLAEAPFPQMLPAVQALNKGGVSSVFQGPEGFYIVKVEDVKGGDKVPFSDIQQDLINALTVQKQQQVLAERLNEIKKRVDNKINPDLLGKTGE